MQSKESNQPSKKRRGRPRRKAEGLGDTIEQITEATGIKKLVKFIAGEDCGCDERKEKLNQLFRYNTPECFTEEEYEKVGVLIKKSAINPEEQKELNTIYNRVFNDKVEMTMCSTCLSDRVKRLKKIHETYAVSEAK
jgi:hypothetical protein